MLKVVQRTALTVRQDLGTELAGHALSIVTARIPTRQEHDRTAGRDSEREGWRSGRIPSTPAHERPPVGPGRRALGVRGRDGAGRGRDQRAQSGEAGAPQVGTVLPC
ncbi:hypothetical protein SHO565_39050 [Streptomyces sp. HO565]